MSWQKYTLCFRLLSPLHIGYRKVGNLMQTRGYVPGKVLWAALTARLTRDSHHRASGQQYVAIGQSVNDSFRFGYLYPTLKNGNDYQTHYPWEKSFDYLFLDSYASTALNYNHQAAAEGQLHETEFIRPYTRPMPNTKQSQPVYLTGFLYVRQDIPEALASWQKSLKRVQFGGERGYGWGRVQLAEGLEGSLINEAPIASPVDGRITAHLQTDESLGLHGAIEPVVGWERNNKNEKEKWTLSKSVICYVPGTADSSHGTFKIGPLGIWQA